MTGVQTCALPISVAEGVGVVARAADQRVVARAAIQNVVARVAGEQVVAGITRCCEPKSSMASLQFCRCS